MHNIERLYIILKNLYSTVFEFNIKNVTSMLLIIICNLILLYIIISYLIIHIGKVTTLQFARFVNLENTLPRGLLFQLLFRSSGPLSIDVFIHIFILFFLFFFFIILLTIFTEFVVIKINAENILCFL